MENHSYFIEDNSEEIQFYMNKYYQCNDMRINDSHFYKVALNLSKKREELEIEATELIDKYGYIKALKKSNI